MARTDFRRFSFRIYANIECVIDGSEPCVSVRNWRSWTHFIGPCALLLGILSQTVEDRAFLTRLLPINVYAKNEITKKLSCAELLEIILIVMLLPLRLPIPLILVTDLRFSCIWHMATTTAIRLYCYQYCGHLLMGINPWANRGSHEPSPPRPHDPPSSMSGIKLIRAPSWMT